MSRPLLDRIDIQVMVDRPSRYQLLDAPDGEHSAVVAERVCAARDRAARRLAGTPWSLNAHVPARALRTRFRPAPGAMAVVERALDEGSLTARGMDKVVRIAWSISDLMGLDRPGADEVGRALALRTGVAGGWAT